MPVLTCKWCGSQYAAVNTLENTCGAHCANMWRRERDRARRAEERGEQHELSRDAVGRVIRKCRRCFTRLSSWNRGEFCHPCWGSMSHEERARKGRRGDLYDANRDLRREREELDAYANGDDWTEASGDSQEGID